MLTTHTHTVKLTCAHTHTPYHRPVAQNLLSFPQPAMAALQSVRSVQADTHAHAYKHTHSRAHAHTHTHSPTCTHSSLALIPLPPVQLAVAALQNARSMLADDPSTLPTAVEVMHEALQGGAPADARSAAALSEVFME